AGRSAPGWRRSTRSQPHSVTSRSASTWPYSPTRDSPGCRPARASATSALRRWPVDPSAASATATSSVSWSTVTGWKAASASAPTRDAGAPILAARAPRADLAPGPDLPADTRLWAVLQQVGGGTWGGCVYDVDAIIAALRGQGV